MNAPTYTPKSKAEFERMRTWLIKSNIPFTWSSDPESFSLGHSQTPLVQLQNTRNAFDLLRQVCEAGGCDAQLLSRINLLLKAVNETNAL